MQYLRDRVLCRSSEPPGIRAPSFYETLNSELLSLLLQGLTPAKHPSPFAVAAFSIWMTGVEEERPPGFRIGLQFRERQPWLFSQFKR